MYKIREVVFLADSNITKRALASALKELMETQPFSHISVSSICDRCEMNRKSFYYHFKDKYDLANWIYNTEFIAITRQKNYSAGWDLWEDMCEYFYENRNYYRKIFNVEGQNSFTDYFRDILAMILTQDLEDVFDDEGSLDFYVNFYVDAFVCAIKRWLARKDCITAQEFSARLKICLIGTSHKIVKDYAPNQ